MYILLNRENVVVDILAEARYIKLQSSNGIVVAAGVENPTLEWHARHEECQPWSLEQLAALSLAISNAVYPKYHQMQDYKTQIFSANSISELAAIELNFADSEVTDGE